MNLKAIRVALIVAVWSALLLTQVEAARTSSTTVYVKNMHCQTCAKKIAGKLYTVSGVLKVRTNYKKNIAVITPQRSKRPSPKALWEAVEAAKFVPVKIASPQGTFTKKPRR